MSETLQINLEIPIRSVGVVDDGKTDSASRAAMKQREAELKRQTEQVNRLCSVLEAACGRLESFYGDTVCSQAECIAKLSVQIAEKILMREIASGNYDIARIIAEALKAAPGKQDVLVRLNPDDLQRYTQMVESETIKPLSRAKLAADASVGRAECVVETEQGTVEYFINEHLRQIGEALEAMQ